LGQRFSLAETVVTLAGRPVVLAHPVSVDDLLDEDDYGRHQRLPYWGTVWPSARFLASRLADAQGQGRRLLELGSGLGLVSIAAALAGFEVLATDYYEDALEFTAANARRNGVTGVTTRWVDWRHYPADLGDFDLVVASDVLYERPNAGLVAAAFAHSLAPHGQGLLTDPGRQVARPFAEQCRRLGLDCQCVDLEQVIDGTVEAIVELYEIAWQPARPKTVQPGCQKTPGGMLE